MNLFSKLIRRPEPMMLLEAQERPSVRNPSEDEVRNLVLSLRVGAISFASLTDETGDYVQVAGSRPWCVIERRSLSPVRHERAFQDTPTPKYKDGAKLRTGAGEIPLQHDEWFLLKDAAEIFVAFLRRDAFPDHVRWRSMNESFGLG